MEANKDIFDIIHDGDKIENLETNIISNSNNQYSSKISFLNDVDACVLCGKSGSKHIYGHKFIQVHDEYRCKHCLKHFFEHPHKFDLNLMKSKHPDHHHFESFTKIT